MRNKLKEISQGSKESLLNETERKWVKEQSDALHNKWVKLSRHDNPSLEYSVVNLKTPNHEKRQFAIFKEEKTFFERHLGRGKFAKVKLAQDLESLSWVALKIEIATVASRIANERNILSKLNRLVGTAKRSKDAKNKYYTAMDLYTGNTFTNISLYDYSVNQLIDFAIQALNELKSLHALNVLHRDISHHNLMLTNSNQVKLIDFGLSIIGKTLLFKTTNKCGTLFPPETLNSQNIVYSTKTDIWCLGKVFDWVLFNDFYLFKNNESMRGFGNSFLSILTQKYLQLKILFLRGYYHSHLQKIKSVYRQMLDHDPDKRPSIDVCIADLENAKAKICPEEFPAYFKSFLRTIKMNIYSFFSKKKEIISEENETSPAQKELLVSNGIMDKTPQFIKIFEKIKISGKSDSISSTKDGNEIILTSSQRKCVSL